MLSSRGSGRRRLSLLLAPLAAVLCLLVSTPAAFAAPGDNGDVKIHNAGTPVTDTRNEPKVCTFYLDAFNFDGLQQVSWVINQQPPTGRAQVSSGHITLDTQGNGHTADMNLPDGHYKLTWTFVGEHGSAKSKVFMVDCGAPSPSPSPSHSPSQSASPSHSPSESASASASPSASPTHTCPVCHSPSASPSASASSSSSPTVSGSPVASPSASSGHGKGKLAATGASLAPLLGGAAGLVLVGALLARRSRRSAHTR